MDPINETLQTLFSQASEYVQQYILSDELDGAVALLGKIHKLPVSSYLPLKNTITLILLGHIEPKDAVTALETNCGLTPLESTKLAEDIDRAILEKVRLSILGKQTPGVKQITLSDGNEIHKGELRKEILDTTKSSAGAPSPATPNQATQPTPRARATLEPGSRSQLLEQLHVLETIPGDDEVEARLNHIKEQVASLESKNVEGLEPTVAADEFMFGDKSGEVVTATEKVATYSTAPTAYNVDPYREIISE